MYIVTVHLYNSHRNIVSGNMFLRKSSNAVVGGTAEGIAIGSSEDAATKANIRKKLVESIKDLQIEYAEGNPSVPIESNELTHQLLTTLEAVFIHGLKGQTAKPKSRHMPEPNFWTFVLVFTHKETIHRLEKLRSITTDIGRGRAWLRLAINEGFLGSYLSAMLADKTSQRRHYQRHAILRDWDLLDVIIRYLNGIEIYTFNLALNSGLLNRWATGPLILAGLLAVTSRPAEAPPVTAIDAASMLDENGVDPLAASTSGAEGASAFEVIAKPAGYLNRGLLNEDEALRLILAGVSPANFSGSSSTATSSPMGTTPNSPPLAVRKDKRPPSAKRRALNNENGKIEPNAEVVRSLNKTSPPSSENGKTEQEDEVQVQRLTTNRDPIVEVEEEIEETESAQNEEEERGQTPVVMSEESKPSDDIMATSMDFPDIYARTQSRSSSSSSGDEEIPDIYASCQNVKQDEDSQKSDKNSKDDDECTSQDTFVTCPQTAVTSSTSSIADQENSGQATPTNKKPGRAGSIASSTKSSSSTANSLTTMTIPYLSGFIDSWNPFANWKHFDTPPENGSTVQPDAGAVKFGFSLKPNVQVGTLSQEDSQRLMAIFDQIIREDGLDTQNYMCAECTRAIGTIFGPAKICTFTKKYYCEVGGNRQYFNLLVFIKHFLQECHLDELVVIPAKVMYNWDFTPFPVCHKAKLFLDSVNVEPVINVKSFNAELLNFAPNLNEVFDLRKQLKFMNAYLFTCQDGNNNRIKQSFHKMLWPRLYLFEDVDMCSIKDLEDINSGRLVTVLTAAAKFARNHIHNCVLCSGKGFICEVCKDDQVIFPFDLDAIMQCTKCFQVFHLDCSSKIATCPRCDRIAERNLNWHVSVSRSQRALVPSN